MRLLVVTQAVDRTNPVLGFFHRWLEELAKQYDALEVICLYEGEHDLPQNVRIHSLGKEHGERSKFAYGFTFIHLAFTLRSQYDSVFVHMNQEYLLVAGWLWKLLDKRMYLWRNHYAGSLLTDIASAFCTKVFCTSKYSYTAKYRKTVLMPVGVDTDRFYVNSQVERLPQSILFLGRISPSKHPDLLIEALGILKRESVTFTASIYGSALPQDAAYAAELERRTEELDLAEVVTFYPGIPNSKTPDIYRAHEVFVNASPSGMFDKTLFEAAASGCVVLTSSRDFAQLAGDRYWFAEGDATMLAASLGRTLHARSDTVQTVSSLAALANEHSLNQLVGRIKSEV